MYTGGPLTVSRPSLAPGSGIMLLLLLIARRPPLCSSAPMAVGAGLQAIDAAARSWEHRARKDFARLVAHISRPVGRVRPGRLERIEVRRLLAPDLYNHILDRPGRGRSSSRNAHALRVLGLRAARQLAARIPCDAVHAHRELVRLVVAVGWRRLWLLQRRRPRENTPARRRRVANRGKLGASSVVVNLS